MRWKWWVSCYYVRISIPRLCPARRGARASTDGRKEKETERKGEKETGWAETRVRSGCLRLAQQPSVDGRTFVRGWQVRLYTRGGQWRLRAPPWRSSETRHSMNPNVVRPSWERHGRNREQREKEGIEQPDEMSTYHCLLWTNRGNKGERKREREEEGGREKKRGLNTVAVPLSFSRVVGTRSRFLMLLAGLMPVSFFCLLYIAVATAVEAAVRCCSGR